MELVALTVVGLVLIAAMALLWKGFQDGDRSEDARVSTRLVYLPRPDGDALHVRVAVDNPARSPVMISARVRAARVDLRFVSEPESRHSTAGHRQRMFDYEPIGAVAGHDCHAWLLPAPAGSAPALHVIVILDQLGGRTRVVTSTLRIARPPRGSSGRSGGGPERDVLPVPTPEPPA